MPNSPSYDYSILVTSANSQIDQQQLHLTILLTCIKAVVFCTDYAGLKHEERAPDGTIFR